MNVTELAISCKEKDKEYYKNVRTEILALFPEHAERVLEVGCGAGHTLSYLKDTGRCAWTSGVEIFHEAAESARSKNIDLVLEGSVSEIELPFDRDSLDVILCLDVLEHLIDPWLILQSLCKYLRSGGVCICSIPNVRNFRVVMPLMVKGEWGYSKEGILDHTHLRFFTKKSAISLVESAGLNVDVVYSTGLERWNKVAIANLLTFNIFRAFFEYQYLIKGVKK